MKVANLFNDPAMIVALVGGVIIPFVVSVLARQEASDNVKSLLAFLAAGLTAVGLYLTDVDGARTWQGGLSVFIVALVMAVTSRKAITEQWVDAVGAKVPGVFGKR